MRAVYLLLLGDHSYAQWAVNLACSIKFCSPAMQIVLLHEPGKQNDIPVNERSVFDEFIEIKKEYCHDGEKITPGIAKLNMYEYFHHEENLYIDLDSIVIKDINGLFDQCKGKIIASDVVNIYDHNSEKWDCKWLSLDDVRSHYPLPEAYTLPEINSSYIYTKKCNEADRFWNQAKENVIKVYQGSWGKSFPDELAFNIAFAQTGVDPDNGHSHAISVTSQLNGIGSSIDKLEKFYYILTYWGGKNMRYASHYSNYDLWAGKVHRSVLGKQNPYKQIDLMRRKYVQTNRTEVKKATIPHHELQLKNFIDSIETELSYSDTSVIDSKKLIQEVDVKGRKFKATNYFNGSIYKYKDQILFAYRVDFVPWFKHTVNCICLLDKDYQPIPETNKQLSLKNDINGHNSEDPYLFTNEKGQLCIAYTDGYKVGYGVFDDQLNIIKSDYILPKNAGGDNYDGREKNWTPIDGTTKFIYNCNKSHIIYEYDDHQLVNEYTGKNELTWKHGTMRGGATAIKHKNLYYHFFHSSIPMNNGIKWGRVYVMGCYVFDENYRVVKITRKPILKGEFIDLKIPRPANTVFVCFPRGVVRQEVGFLVSFGSNDYENRLIKISDDQLNQMMINE
jgi:predicted GH43/DUF377 family glycosyl hydrolase